MEKHHSSAPSMNTIIHKHPPLSGTVSQPLTYPAPQKIKFAVAPYDQEEEDGRRQTMWLRKSAISVPRLQKFYRRCTRQP